MDAVNELMRHRAEQGAKSVMLKRVWRFHEAKPEVLDFLVQELREVRANGWTRTSVGSLWHHARWVLTQQLRAPGETYVMTNNYFPWYERIIVILHPEFNGFFEMAKSRADEDFGTMLEPVSSDRESGYIRRLIWRDGKEIEAGWRPSVPHEPKPVARRKRVVQLS